MFPVLLAFLVWAFATGEYKAWMALLSSPSSTNAATTAVNGAAGMTNTYGGVTGTRMQ